MIIALAFPPPIRKNLGGRHPVSSPHDVCEHSAVPSHPRHYHHGHFCIFEKNLQAVDLRRVISILPQSPSCLSSRAYILHTHFCIFGRWPCSRTERRRKGGRDCCGRGAGRHASWRHLTTGQQQPHCSDNPVFRRRKRLRHSSPPHPT